MKSFGGLFVLGTERHDARRIDNQLRGRSGRQGDRGETQFFVSFEDSLMRIFAVDTIKTMMGRFNIPEDEPIENKLITNALEKAQEKIEGFNFDSRKHILEFDDVLNFQRKIIYERRRKILSGEKPDVEEYLKENQIEPKIALESQALELIRAAILQTTDIFWVDHLEMMDYLRSSVNLRAYGQREPLVEYKKEGLRFFRQMEDSIARQVSELVQALDSDKIKSLTARPPENLSDEVQSPSDEHKNVGRNDPCPCGSGKKYKKCHGALS